MEAFAAPPGTHWQATARGYQSQHRRYAQSLFSLLAFAQRPPPPPIEDTLAGSQSPLDMYRLRPQVAQDPVSRLNVPIPPLPVGTDGLPRAGHLVLAESLPTASLLRPRPREACHCQIPRARGDPVRPRPERMGFARGRHRDRDLSLSIYDRSLGTSPGQAAEIESPVQVAPAHDSLFSPGLFRDGRWCTLCRCYHRSTGLVYACRVIRLRRRAGAWAVS